ncbi:putative WD repeat domain phosphoinositide-interacting protein 2 [Hypsibius exemplaris]|uniref:WD repeat domain phosphoinositide-interacting protein 2 n=1 Tax=Hypsibius exemplaris TaxID=2072580 RepID=A0A1W0WPV7_HYPEX|nr:putative WD repeat domain phosphoinositide-interacting protein 2 [Hypsibius exemplaris]
MSAQVNSDVPSVIEMKPDEDVAALKTPSHVTCLRFNQDGGSLIAATSEGFRVFDVSATTGEVVMVYDFDNVPQVLHIQRLYNSNLIAFVSAVDPDVLKIFNLRRKEVICQHRYRKPVDWLAVNRLRVVTAVAQKVFIHKIRNMEIIHTIPDVHSNPAHLYAMATYELRSFLAYPCDLASGDVVVYDLDCFKERHRVHAHRIPIAALCLNEQVTRLATSSTKGTVVRVFDTATGRKLHEFRRGIRAVAVHCLAFSSNGEYLGCSSEHETVHLFRVPTNEQRVQLQEEQGWLASVGSLATQATGLVCAEAERFMQEERSFATLPNPYHGLKTKLSLTSVMGSQAAEITNPFQYLNARSPKEDVRILLPCRCLHCVALQRHLVPRREGPRQGSRQVPSREAALRQVSADLPPVRAPIVVSDPLTGVITITHDPQNGITAPEAKLTTHCQTGGGLNLVLVAGSGTVSVAPSSAPRRVRCESDDQAKCVSEFPIPNAAAVALVISKEDGALCGRTQEDATVAPNVVADVHPAVVNVPITFSIETPTEAIDGKWDFIITPDNKDALEGQNFRIVECKALAPNLANPGNNLEELLIEGGCIRDGGVSVTTSDSPDKQQVTVAVFQFIDNPTAAVKLQCQLALCEGPTCSDIPALGQPCTPRPAGTRSRVRRAIASAQLFQVMTTL